MSGIATSWSVEELLGLLAPSGARLAYASMPTHTRVASVLPIEQARPDALCFARSEGHAKRWLDSPSPLLLLSSSAWEPLSHLPEFQSLAHAGRSVLLVHDADLALIDLLERLPQPTPTSTPGVHHSAAIEAGASIDPSACIGPACVIEHGATIGPRTVLRAQCFVGAGSRVGSDCLLHPGVRVLPRCVVGDRCILHSGVVLGADGFGYRPDAGGLRKVPHVGTVVLGDDVEIGANSCVDRGKLGPTTVGSGTKIDNLVQIGHNCTIGRCCILCGNSGLAGSVTLGDGVVLGGGASIADNVTIGSGARIAALSGVTSNVEAGAALMGIPAIPTTRWYAFYKAMLRLSRGRQ